MDAEMAFFLERLFESQKAVEWQREAEWERFAFGVDKRFGRASCSMSRARLILLSLGCTTKSYSAAVAVEYVHNASLIVDDLIDGALVRRGEEAFWAKFGREEAILASHVLLQKAFVTLAERDADSAMSKQLIRRLADTVKTMACNEAEALKVRVIDLDSYLHRISCRTAKLYCIVGELMGECPLLSKKTAHLVDVMERVGVCHQIADDFCDSDPAGGYLGVFCDSRFHDRNVQDSVFELTKHGYDQEELRELHSEMTAAAVGKFRLLVKDHDRCEELVAVVRNVCGVATTAAELV